MKHTLIISEKQAKHLYKELTPVKKVNSAIMQAVSAGEGMGIAEDREPDYEIGFENNSPLDYGHVIGSAAPPVNESTEKTETLYHGLNRKNLEYCLEIGSFVPRVCAEGGPKAIWLSENKWKYEFSYKVTVPTDDLYQETNVDYTYEGEIPVDSAVLVSTDFYVFLEGMAVNVNLLNCELLNRQYELFGDAFCEAIYDDFKDYPNILNQIIRPSIEKCIPIKEGKSSKKKILNDEGEEVPETCDACGSKVCVKIKGEPVYVCSKCGKYFGTMPFTLKEEVELEEETNPEDVDLSSFETKEELSPRFWKDGKLDSRIRIQLLDIADKFIETLDYPITAKDVIITGSIANFNWDENYSDVDLHILIDFDDYDEDKNLLKDYFDSKRKLWNEEHDGIKIYGFSVELYVQDVNEEHKASGVYSLDSNKWLKEPIKGELKYKDIESDDVKEGVSKYMNIIDELADRLDACESKYDAKEIFYDSNKWFKRIKEERKTSLQGDSTEYATGNIVFKTLRRNGYLEKLLDIKVDAFDKYYSLP